VATKPVKKKANEIPAIVKEGLEHMVSRGREAAESGDGHTENVEAVLESMKPEDVPFLIIGLTEWGYENRHNAIVGTLSFLNELSVLKRRKFGRLSKRMLIEALKLSEEEDSPR
jgi:hypothetical protein